MFQSHSQPITARLTRHPLPYSLCDSPAYEFITEPIARQVLHTVLVGQRCYDACREVAGEIISQENKILEASTGSYACSREVPEIRLRRSKLISMLEPTILPFADMQQLTSARMP